MGLNEIAKEFKKEWASSATGPLVLAARVMSLSTEWDQYKAESGDLSFSSWLQQQTGKKLGWFRIRHEAVRTLGEAVRRTLHHETAVYVMNSVQEELRAEVVERLIKDKVLRGYVPTLDQVMPVIIGVIGNTSGRVRKCVACAQKEERIRELEALLDSLSVNHAAE